MCFNKSWIQDDKHRKPIFSGYSSSIKHSGYLPGYRGRCDMFVSELSIENVTLCEDIYRMSNLNKQWYANWILGHSWHIPTTAMFRSKYTVINVIPLLVIQRVIHLQHSSHILPFVFDSQYIFDDNVFFSKTKCKTEKERVEMLWQMLCYWSKQTAWETGQCVVVVTVRFQRFKWPVLDSWR